MHGPLVTRDLKHSWLGLLKWGGFELVVSLNTRRSTASNAPSARRRKVHFTGCFFPNAHRIAHKDSVKVGFSHRRMSSMINNQRILELESLPFKMKLELNSARRKWDDRLKAINTKAAEE